MGKFVGSKGSTQKSGEAPGTCYANDAESPGGTGGAQAEQRTKRGPPLISLPPSFSHPFILSVTPSLAPAANLKQQVPTPLLRGSRSPSGFLLPVADVYARGERFPLLEKFRGFCWRASLLRGVNLAREC